ncbi:MAG: nitronate monooxygenase [Rhodospirillaceae bacterium]|jgi:nitronate monooxygenase|nr:nitronate monooxygenase [Rhodospirillaceae bacterium]MBT5516138.1 nitronate monooxygenase [Rhodospirillaceae bacterium]MBT6086101.1 nitronate monooxygenase [Rhodospirillaceae bacterium]MBT6885937.1 nitronate monooxygenase [Rhodospirillaceae bacterium]MBT7249135.1 nitronate monooxygenase [Rhodospirillaceae bacterium]
MANWTESWITERLGLRFPIIQAPMAGSSSNELAVAVSRAGGMGSMGVALQSAEATRADCETVRAGTNGAYNVNFFVHKDAEIDASKGDAFRAQLAPYYEELGLGEVPAAEVSSLPFNEDHLAVVLDQKPPVVSFHFGMPRDELFAAVKDAGIFTISSATNVREAQELERRGIDAIIAQGFEAGGHRGTFAEPYEDGWVGTMALVPQIVDAVSVPVIAAGGIMDGRGIAAALVLGADAVQLGTAFLNCPESAVPDVHREALKNARDDQTRLTHAFSGRPARGIENRYIRETKGGEDNFPDFPILNTLTGPMRKASAEAGTGDFMSLWAGQGVTMTRDLPAAELLEKLVAETDAVLGKLI